MNAMEIVQKRIGRKMGICMGCTMGGIMSLIGTISSGHFTAVSLIVSFIISLVVSGFLGFIIPVKTITDAFLTKMGTDDKQLKGKLLGALVGDFIFTPIMAGSMSFLGMSMAVKNMDASIAEINGAQAALTHQINEKTAERDALQAQLDELKKKAEDGIPDLNEQIGNMTGGVESLNGAIAGMQKGIEDQNAAKANIESSKPNIPMGVLRSILLDLVICYFIVLIIQPIYLKLIFRSEGISM